MQIRLSPTSIRDYRTCPWKYALRYEAGLEPDQDADALRVGGAWHKAQEAYKVASAEGWEPLSSARTVLDNLYTSIPPGYDAREWEAEREMIWASFVAYQEIYANKNIKSLSVEDKHIFPLFNPHTGMPIPSSDAVCVVKVDELVEEDGTPAVFEMKSTSREIAPGSDYWQSLRLDIQVSFYAYWGEMVYGTINPTIYDVWRKPLLRLKKNEPIQEYVVRINHELRADPAKHFQRHRIARTAQDMENFRLELWNVYQAIKAMRERDGWYANESNCISFIGNCPYKKVCFGEGARRTITEQLVPLGFRKKPPLVGEKVGA